MNQSLSCTVVILQSLVRWRTAYLNIFHLLKRQTMLDMIKKNISKNSACQLTTRAILSRIYFKYSQKRSKGKTERVDPCVVFFFYILNFKSNYFVLFLSASIFHFAFFFFYFFLFLSTRKVILTVILHIFTVYSWAFFRYNEHSQNRKITNLDWL